MATTPNGPWHDWLGSLAANPNAAKVIERLSAAGIAATLCIPMIFSGKVAGMFGIRFKQKREIRQEEIELTRAMTHQAMLALQLMRFRNKAVKLRSCRSATGWRATFTTRWLKDSPE